MWKPVHHSAAWSCIGLSLLVPVLLLCSCDDVESHNMLTFFFDGVPPLPGEGAGPGPADANAANADAFRTGGWHVHKPLSNCTECHGSRPKTFSRQVHLVAGVPALCHKCHEKDATPDGWVHGPVAAGECLLCHEPHKTKNQSLLVKPVPELCHSCHEPQTVRLIDNHADPSYARCTSCHSGHSGPTKSLLTATFLEQSAGGSYLVEIHQRQYEEAGKRARDDLARTGSSVAILDAAIGHIEAGQWWPARAYLETVKESDMLANQEKRSVNEMLQQVIAVSQGQPQSHPDRAPLAAELRAICERRREQEQTTAQRYFASIQAYHAGRFAQARQGFAEVLRDRSVPAPMKETAGDYLKQIDKRLQGPDRSSRQLVK